MHTEERIFSNPKTYYDLLIQDIESAHESIYLETYIFEIDPVGIRIADALIRAAEKGVRTYCMVDGVGSFRFSGPVVEKMRNAGVHIQVYNPIPWHFHQWGNRRVTSLLGKFFALFSRLNRRNHRKLCLIDGKIAWTGSLNVCESHLIVQNDSFLWRDTSLRLKRTGIDVLQKCFERAWDNPPLKLSKSNFQWLSVFRFNHTLKQRRKIHKDLIRRIKHATERVWITNAYFIPLGNLRRALQYAARFGVDVRLLLPKRSDVFFIPWASSVYFNSLLRAGVRIFQYKEGILHAKTTLIDHWATVGSTNLNHRSLLHDLEIDFVVTKDESIKTLEQLFLHDIEKSDEITLEIFRSQFKLQRFLGRLIFLLRKWM